MMQIETEDIQRTFFPGDKWLYLKLYGGIVSCEKALACILYPLLQDFKSKHLISKWFFIRYNDPEFHLRIRLELVDTAMIGTIILKVHAALFNIKDNNKIYNYSISTYQREIERYGKYMVLCETIFSHDSVCIGKVLNLLYGNSIEIKDRWIVAMLLIETLFRSLRLKDTEKLHYIDLLDESFLKEFGFNAHNKKELGLRYRKFEQKIRTVIDSLGKEQKEPLTQIFEEYYANLQVALSESVITDELNITSIIHMSMNRLFAYNNRANEMVVYNFLKRYYKTQLIKSKSLKKN